MLKALSILSLLLYLNIWLRLLCPYSGDNFNDEYEVVVADGIRNTPEMECLDICYLQDINGNISDKSDIQHPNIPYGTNVNEIIAVVEESVFSIVRFASLSKESDIIHSKGFFSDFLFTPPEPPPKA